MEKYYSKKQPDLLLHIVFRFSDFKDGRMEIIDSDNFLQGAAMVLDRQSFRPHTHIETTVTYSKRKAQEAWIVLSGLIKCIFYDIDNIVLAEPILMEKDICFTLHGGHAFTVLEDGTHVLEIKTGPYEGQLKDKIFINE